MAPFPSAFSRSVLGYRPEAVHESSAYLERFYQAEKLALSAHLWDVVRSLEHLKRLAEMAGAIRAAVTVSERKVSLAGAVSGGADEPRPVAVAMPSLRPLPLMPWGYSRTEVDQFLAGLRSRCEKELEDLIRQTMAVEGQRSALLARLGESLRMVKANLEQPVVRTAAVQSASGRVVALRRKEGGGTTEVGPDRAAAPEARRARTAWRPGAIEESELHAAPVPGRRIAGGSVTQLLLPFLGPQPAPAPVTAYLPEEASTSAPLASVEEQVQQGLTARLQGLHRRFLAGKAVGADLAAPSGELLAVRGTPITPELVGRAEQAGVLAALIANMTLSDWGGEK